MRIENTLSQKLEIPVSNPSWDSFFSRFSEELTPREKNKIIEFFHQQLSHDIHHQMQRMIRVYKKMREER